MIEETIAAERHRWPLSHWRTVLLNDPCAYCGEPSNEVDHIRPLHAAGENEASNLTGACKGCNRDKRGRSLLAFLSGHDCGHARQLGASRAIAEQPTREPREGRWISTAEERSLWLFAEHCYRLAHKAKHGEPPPKRALPPHLA